MFVSVGSESNVGEGLNLCRGTHSYRGGRAARAYPPQPEHQQDSPAPLPATCYPSSARRNGRERDRAGDDLRRHPDGRFRAPLVRRAALSFLPAFTPAFPVLFRSLLVPPAARPECVASLREGAGVGCIAAWAVQRAALSVDFWQLNRDTSQQAARALPSRLPTAPTPHPGPPASATPQASPSTPGRASCGQRRTSGTPSETTRRRTSSRRCLRGRFSGGRGSTAGAIRRVDYTPG